MKRKTKTNNIYKQTATLKAKLSEIQLKYKLKQRRVLIHGLPKRQKRQNRSADDAIL